MTSPLPPAPSKHDTPLDQERPLWDHLDELRSRLIGSLAAWAAFTLPGYWLSPVLIGHLADSVGPMVFVRPAEAFLVRVKIAFLAGAILAAPVWLYHAWRFVGAGLTVLERRVAAAAVPFSAVLFAAGAAMAWFLIAPVGLRFLVGFASADLRPMISVDAALGFTLWLCLGMGTLFQLPIVLGVLARSGLVTAGDLRRHRRHAVLGILVAAALFTPGPDVASQLLLALPTYALYEVSILLSARLAPGDPPAG